MSNKSIADQYEIKTDIEHIIDRPGLYIGSNQVVKETIFIADNDFNIIKKEIEYVPGLERIYEEVLLNAFDQSVRLDTNTTEIRVNIDKENNIISVFNNGSGIPIIIKKELGIYIPEMIFGMLRTSSNYNDNEKRITGGLNGLGAKLTNIFSTSFKLETVDSTNKLYFELEWTNSMNDKGKNIIKSYKKSSYTKIIFKPNLKLFNLRELTDDIIALMKKRLIDIGFNSHSKVKIYYNDILIPIKSTVDYISLYNIINDDNPPIVDITNERWHIGILYSNNGFQNISFVNGVNTTGGGSHVDHVLEIISKEIIEKIKKTKKIELKLSDIKNNIYLFVKSFIENPIFNSQTKECLKMSKTKFGSKYIMSEKFKKQILKSNIIERLSNISDNKLDKELTKTNGIKRERLLGIKNLEDANWAGSKKKSRECKLILTEGLSAKTFAMSALSIIGRDKYGIFPLKGKLLNVRDASNSKIAGNEEICNIVKILGLQYKMEYNEYNISQLRYGGIINLTDSDEDGSHISGLIMNFIHNFWPQLIQMNFIFICPTPIVKISKGKNILSFYTLNEYKQWSEKNKTSGFNIRYYKGLGTSTAIEAKEAMTDIDNKLINIKTDNNTNNSINLAFNKTLADERKDWLMTKYNPNNNIDRNNKELLVSDFINKELIHFSYYDNQRSIPNMVDGLKPSQRKVLYVAINSLEKNDCKVSQFANKVAEKTDYHHGEVSLIGTVINMAQNYIGSNNINLLLPKGNLGTRLHNGSDAAAARYTFTILSNITSIIFDNRDSNILTYLYSDGDKIEPEWFIPIVPNILINGCTGIGTGFSSNVLKYDSEKICKYIITKLNGKIPVRNISPWYRGFKGKIVENSNNKYTTFGNYSIIEKLKAIQINELPIGISINNYKEYLESLLLDNNTIIHDIKFNHTDVRIDFIIMFNSENFDKIKKMSTDNITTMFKLTSKLSATNMYLFNKDHIITKYNSIYDILDEFYEIRLEYYDKRKKYIINKLEYELLILSNKAKFIRYIKNSKINIIKMNNSELITKLNYEKFSKIPETDNDYKYLVNMPIRSITNENANELDLLSNNKETELNNIKSISIKDMWITDLKNLMKVNSNINDLLEIESLS
jgi:DNA topoisomerase-2